MKGIVLAGGHGTRLYPITQGISKQLLPLYDKPMIYYSLSVLMLAGIQDILIITRPEDQDSFFNLLGDGSRFGVNLNYAIQAEPKGLVQAFIIGSHFIGTDRVTLILGDNFFYGQNFISQLREAIARERGATVFGYRVKYPEHFGILVFDKNNKVISIEEKPQNPKSSYAVTGLYFYDNQVVEFAKEIKPSERGELEITDLNLLYLSNDELYVKLVGRGLTWLDMGTYQTLLEAGQFVQTVEHRQGFKIACLEEIALHNKWLTFDEIKKAAREYLKTSYGQYLMTLMERNNGFFE